MPVKRVRGGWKAKSAITGKWFKTVHKTKGGAESQGRGSKKRRRRVRSTRSQRARRGRK